MSEPTTAMKGVAVAGVMYGIFPATHNSTIVASVCGALLFLYFTNEPSIKKNALAFILSIACGLYLADFIANLIQHVFGIAISQQGGALIASAVSTGAIGWLIKATKNPIKTLKSFKEAEKGSDDEGGNNNESK